MVLIRLSETAKMLDVRPETVRKWVRNGLLKPIVLPSKQVRFVREKIEELLSDEKAQEGDV